LASLLHRPAIAGAISTPGTFAGSTTAATLPLSSAGRLLLTTTGRFQKPAAIART